MTRSCSRRRSALSPTMPTQLALYPSCFDWRGARRIFFLRRNSRESSSSYLYPRLHQERTSRWRGWALARHWPGDLSTPPVTAESRRARCNLHQRSYRRHVKSTAVFPKFHGNSKANASAASYGPSWIGRSSPRCYCSSPSLTLRLHRPRDIPEYQPSLTAVRSGHLLE